jgi:single-stranded-DNA-specific exonuclease
LSVGDHEVLDGMILKNMKEGLQLLNQHIRNQSNIHIQVDSDTDGYMSSAIMIQYLKKVSPNLKITYTIHKGKEHGIIPEILKGYEFDLLIVPDAGSNDIYQCKQLKNQGKDILIIDHHEIENENKYATVINCMDGQYKNPHLSGTAMVYKFCKEYDKMYGHNVADEFFDLVAVGTIADMIDLRSYEARWFVLKGVEKLGKGNEFLKEIMNQNEFQIQGKPNITKVAWFVSPYINCCIRSGTQEEKINMFRAILGEQEEIEYLPKATNENSNPGPEKITLQKYMAKILKNIKNRQDREVKGHVEFLIKSVENEGKNSDKILILNAPEDSSQTYTGLIANKLASHFKRPVLLLRKDARFDDQFGGSGRNYSLSPIDDLRQFLLDLNVFENVSGHSNAFGVGLKENKVDELRQLINEKLKDMSLEDVYHVDYEINVGRLRIRDIKRVAEWEDMWGGMLEEPLFAITNIYLPTDKIQLIGDKKNIIRFEAKGISFIKKFTSEDEYNRMTMRQSKGLNRNRPKSVKLDVIGKFKLNEWNNSKYPQVEVVDFNVTDGRDFIF